MRMVAIEMVRSGQTRYISKVKRKGFAERVDVEFEIGLGFTTL